MRNPSKSFRVRPYNNNSATYFEVTDCRGAVHTTNALTHPQAEAVMRELHRIVKATGEGVSYNAAVCLEADVVSGRFEHQGQTNDVL